ncbi:MAG TPA: acyl carrier protein [Candidatus Acidoferrales bacterium]
MTVDSAKFRDCVIRALNLRAEQYRPELQIGDVDQWDSVAHLDLMSEIEREFGVRFDLDQITTLTSLPEMVQWLESAK